MRWLAVFISLVLLCCGCASVQPQLEGGSVVEVARVPDPIFRAYLLEQGYAEPYKGSMEGWGLFTPQREILKSTAAGREAKVLKVYGKGIRLLKGVELLGSLEVLVCSENPLKEVELGNLRQLRQFVALETPLQQLDLSRNDSLRVVEISYTDLDSLDVSHNTHLVELLCIFSPRIEELDISHNPELEVLYIRKTSIKEIDLSHCAAFRVLHALDTPLEKIIVTSEQLERVQASVEDSVKVQVMSEE